MDLLTIAEILGDKELKMTRRHAHVALTHRLAAIGLLENAYNQGNQATDGSNSTAPALLAP